MKAYKRYSSAKKAANGGVVLSIHGRDGSLHIAGLSGLDEVMLSTPDSTSYAGEITLLHLNRLGNANHAAAASPEWSNRPDAFPEFNK